MGFLRRSKPSGYETAEIFDDLRGRALNLTPNELGLDPQQTPVTAALMELGNPEAVASLVAVADGAASLYLSNGGGTIGAGEHSPVRDAARSFVAAAGEFGTEMEEVRIAPLPDQGGVRFQLVTVSGIRSACASEDVLAAGDHPLSGLFFAGHELIAAIRQQEGSG